MGATPHRVVLRRDKLRLLRYAQRRRRYATPLVLIPALISRPYVLDLQPGWSFVEALLDAGFDVYLADWGVAGDEDAHRGLDGYLADYLPRISTRVLEASDAKQFALIGYCMGGTMAVSYAASFPEAPIAALVTLASPIDFRHGGHFTRWCAAGRFDVRRIVETFGNVPPHLIAAAFHAIAPTLRLRLALTLLEEAGNPRFDDRFRAMDRWSNEWLPFPGQAAIDWVTCYYQQNRLVRGTLRVAGRHADLRAIDVPLLCIAATRDLIAPPASVAPLVHLVGSREATFDSVAGGHVGIMAGRGAQSGLWRRVCSWLREQLT